MLKYAFFILAFTVNIVKCLDIKEERKSLFKLLDELMTDEKIMFSPRNLVAPLQADDCYDSATWCQKYKHFCKHHAINTFCRKTCKICSFETFVANGGCLDYLSRCGDYVKHCREERYVSYMMSKCKRTCGYCNDEVKCGIAKKRLQKMKTNNLKDNPTMKTPVSNLVQGNPTKAGYYPWQVAIYIKNELNCGGSLIDEQHVLTAAHCFVDFTLPKVTVTLGEHNRSQVEGNEVSKNVSSVIIHEDYNENTNEHDIAIIKLSERVSFTDYITPICLPTAKESLDSGRKCKVSGWGRRNAGGPSSDILQDLELPVVSRQVCKEKNRNHEFKVTENMICAGFNDGVRYSTACHGDSGGPLQCANTDDSGIWTLFGVVSWGSAQCNGFEEHSVFTSVSKYLKWIEDNTSI